MRVRDSQVSALKASVSDTHAVIIADAYPLPTDTADVGVANCSRSHRQT